MNLDTRDKSDTYLVPFVPNPAALNPRSTIPHTPRSFPACAFTFVNTPTLENPASLASCVGALSRSWFGSAPLNPSTRRVATSAAGPCGVSRTYACWMAPIRPNGVSAVGAWYSRSHASAPATAPGPHRASGTTHATSLASHGDDEILRMATRQSASDAASASGVAPRAPIGVARTIPSRPEPRAARAMVCTLVPSLVALFDRDGWASSDLSAMIHS